MLEMLTPAGTILVDLRSLSELQEIYSHADHQLPGTAGLLSTASLDIICTA